MPENEREPMHVAIQGLKTISPCWGAGETIEGQETHVRDFFPQSIPLISDFARWCHGRGESSQIWQGNVCVSCESQSTHCIHPCKHAFMHACMHTCKHAHMHTCKHITKHGIS